MTMLNNLTTNNEVNNMGTLKTWLQIRNRENVLNKTVAHMQKVLECTVEFERGFTFYFEEGNAQLGIKVFDRVDKLEHEADILRRELLSIISSSELVPQIREDLTHLVKRIDRIANTANGAARRLSGIQEQFIRELGNWVFDKMAKIVRHSLDATKILFKIIKKFPEIEPKEVFVLTEQIQHHEHECDILHSEIYKDLNKLNDNTFNHFVAIQISNFVDMLESISDKVEDVADYIELLKTANA